MVTSFFLKWVAGLRSFDAPAMCDEAASAVRGRTFKCNAWWCA
jgi:hypothetical protein